MGKDLLNAKRNERNKCCMSAQLARLACFQTPFGPPPITVIVIWKEAVPLDPL